MAAGSPSAPACPAASVKAQHANRRSPTHEKPSSSTSKRLRLTTCRFPQSTSPPCWWRYEQTRAFRDASASKRWLKRVPWDCASRAVMLYCAVATRLHRSWCRITRSRIEAPCELSFGQQTLASRSSTGCFSGRCSAVELHDHLVPYRPNWVEIILSNRNTLAYLKEFLVRHLPKNAAGELRFQN